MKKVLILKTGRKDFDSEMLLRLNEYGEGQIAYNINHYDSIEIKIKNDKVSVTVNNKDITDYSFVYFKSWIKQKRIATSIATYLKSKGNKFSDKVVGDTAASMDKLFQTLSLALNNIQVPASIFFSNLESSHFEKVSNFLGDIFVAKTISGKEGEHNYLISNQEDFQQNIMSNPNVRFIFQEFIPNEFDYRVGVMGDKAKYIKKRIRKDNSTHKNNVFLGAQVEYLDVEENMELAEISINSANLLQRDIAGVDVIQSSNDGKLYVLEVNPSPAFRHDLNVVKYLNDYIKGELE